jgi:hypothetical protein
MTDQQIINAFYWAKSSGIVATAYIIGPAL